MLRLKNIQSIRLCKYTATKSFPLAAGFSTRHKDTQKFKYQISNFRPLFFVFCFLSSFLFGAEVKIELLPYAGDSATQTPYTVKVKAESLNPTDTAIELSVWCYDRARSHIVSQIWTREGWKYPTYGYQPFCLNTGSQRIGWAYIKIYKEVATDTNNYYIKCKIKNSDTVESVPIEYPEFKILNAQECGWLTGTIYKDALLDTPYSKINIILKNSAANVVGAYVTEDNQIDEGAPPISGRFCIVVPVGSINSIEVQDSIGNIVENGYTATLPTWEISPGETTWVDPLYIENIEFIPEAPSLGDSVRIQVRICNPGEEMYNVYVQVSCKTTQQNIGEVVVNTIPAHSCATPEIVWKNVNRGKYQIEVQVRVGQFKCSFSQYLQVGIGDVLINEIMYSPKNSGEWIEIINQDTNTVNLKNWTMDNNIITSEDKLLSPGGFAVIAESTAQVLHSIYGEFNAEVLSLGSKFPSLKDDGDSIILRDSDGILQERLKYEANWATNTNKGISLERVSPTMPTNNYSNWGSCVNISAGATPGEINSLYAEHLTEKVTLSVYPEVFSPNKETTDISYTLPFTQAEVRLYLYDRCGRCVRKLMNKQPSGAYFKCQWDGKNDKNEILPIGIYIIYLEANDMLSNKSVSQKKTVVMVK
ncbi:MAG: lamin tail domain-containing protein [Candidatus Stahlbacteria bacterium]|nr:lamin tail domain-containing protein [Candidatus Stahlbacteria bacterium]